MSEEDKTQLNRHTLLTLLTVMIAFSALAIQVSIQFNQLFERVIKTQTEVELLEKHMDNVQYQLDHERAVR